MVEVHEEVVKSMANADSHKMNYLLPENKLGRKLCTFQRKLELLFTKSGDSQNILYLLTCLLITAFYLFRFLFTFAYGVPLHFRVLFLHKQNHLLVLPLKHVYFFRISCTAQYF